MNMNKLSQGKLPGEILSRIVSKSPLDGSVIVGPRVGFDSGIIQIENNTLVVTTDPAIYLPRNIPIDMFAFGAVHFAASDVAVFGALPRYMLYNFLVPVGTKVEFAETVSELICEHCKKLNISIVGGHTGAYYGIETPVIATTMMGHPINSEFILPSNAKPGDKILVTKWIGLEFVVALAYYDEEKLRRIIGDKKLREFKQLYILETVVDEALLLTKENLTRAMHDITEGGLATALNELADASNVGFRVEYEKLPMTPEISCVLSALNINPLHVSSTGSLLAAIPNEYVDQALEILHKNNIPATTIGEFIKNTETRELIMRNKVLPFPRENTDAFAEYFKLEKNL